MSNNDHLIRRLADRLLEVPIDGVITHAAIHDIVGNKRYLMTPAKRLAAEEAGAYFNTKYKEGYQRVATQEAVPALDARSSSRVKKIARQTMVTAGQIATKANDIDPATIIDAHAVQVKYGLIYHQAHVRNTKIKASEMVVQNGGDTADTARKSLETMHTMLGRNK